MVKGTVEAGLVLRLLEPRHAEALFRLIDRNRDSLSHWFSWVEATKTVADSETFIRESLTAFANEGVFQLGIWRNDEFAGIIGLQSISRFFHSTELYYWLGATYRGHGLMTKACRHLCGYLFDDLELNRIEIRCAETNLKSRAVPERLGFTLGGILREMGYTRDGLVDYLVYSLLKREWPRWPRRSKTSGSGRSAGCARTVKGYPEIF